MNFILYLIFGAATTIVNIVSYYFCARLLHLGMARSNVAAWILAVSFAYLTNRKWVFESGADRWQIIMKELIAFFCAGWQPEFWIWQLCISDASLCI